MSETLRDRTQPSIAEPAQPATTSRHTSQRPLKSIDAISAILSVSSARSLGSEVIALDTATGRIACEDILSPFDLPAFDRSAVDGYGIHRDDLYFDPIDLALTARLPAGQDAASMEMTAGETIWLATGAAIPTGVAGVVMEEHAGLASAATVRVAGRRIEMGDNIRRRGEDVAIGTVIVKRGASLDARHTAILAAVGIAEVRVRHKVRVLVISTGDELIAPPDRGTRFKTFDSNRPMLLALLRSPATEVHDGGLFGDDPIPLSIALRKASERFDLIITSGAAAGSETDRVADAVRQALGHVEQHHVAIKPGKPLMIGAVGQAVFLGLPGNPVAAYVTAKLFALPLIQSMSGHLGSPRGSEAAVAGADMRHKSGRTEFAPARIIGTAADGRKLVVKTGSGGSASLMPLVHADGLVEIGAQSPDICCGHAVTFHSFSAHDLCGAGRTQRSVEASDDLRCH